MKKIRNRTGSPNILSLMPYTCPMWPSLLYTVGSPPSRVLIFFQSGGEAQDKKYM